MKTVTYRAPVDYEFTAADRERYRDSFARMNPKCITRYHVADLWERSRVAVSVLPVLMLWTWPGKRTDRRLLDGVTLPADLSHRTPWASMPYRMIAALAGVNKDSVSTAFRALVRHNVMDTTTVRYGETSRTYFRIASAIYAEPGERYVSLPARLFFGGHWPMMHPSTRAAYLVLTFRDPIFDEGRFEAVLGHKRTPESKRAANTTSLRQMIRYSGLSRRSASRAFVDLQEYFERGSANGSHWFKRLPLTWDYPLEVLNRHLMPHRAVRAWPQALPAAGELVEVAQ